MTRNTGARPGVSRAAAMMVVAIALALPGCSSAASRAEPTSKAGVTGTVVVYAAASLTESFTVIAQRFERLYPGATVTLNFGGSSALAEGIVSGAPVDVFAAASPATMSTITNAGLADGVPKVFAGNTLEIAVPAGNPAAITGIGDFADDDTTIALCSPEVPCGAAAARVFADAGIVPAPDTLEQDVRAALTKVELGEVDAAMVYRTDVQAAGTSVEGIEFPEAADVVSDYLLVRLADAPNRVAAAAFVSVVRSEKGREILSDAGFTTN